MIFFFFFNFISYIIIITVLPFTLAVIAQFMNVVTCTQV